MRRGCGRGGTGRHNERIEVRRIQVYVVLPPRVLLLDVAGPVEVLRCANQVQSAVQFDVHYVAATGTVQSSIGLPIAAAEPLPSRLPETAWVVVAGDVDDVMLPDGRDRARLPVDADSADECAIVAWLRDVVQPDTMLICICTGALLAARAGLLDGRACTTHHASCAELAQIAPSARVLENRLYVSEGLCHTSAGITTGIDLMLHIVGELTAPSCCAAIARYLVMYLRRSGADPQLSPWLEGRNHVHPAIHRVQDAVAADLTRAWSLSALARIACVSDRHLSRLFNEHVGMSIVQYVNRLRVARAQDLLSKTQLAMEHVAEQTGFGSVRQFRRAWHRVHAMAPRKMRGDADAVSH
ncbi:MAG: helix-turn-helix domain-containing protein [Proteobacteria bacterium]|nr:helix-turn-helix domain-containing protein [Pseudomonadota bacterium]